MRAKKEYSAQWIIPVELNQPAIDQLSRLFKRRNHALSETTFTYCVEALTSSAELHQLTLSCEDNPSTLRQQLTSLKSAYTKINKTLAEMNGHDEELLDQYYHLANNRDSSFLYSSPKSGGSQFYAIAEKMLNAISLYNDTIPNPIKGRQRDKTFFIALSDFKDKFIKIFPDEKPTADRKSLFYELVVFLFNECLDHKITRPERHIETLLKLTQNK